MKHVVVKKGDKQIYREKVHWALGFVFGMIKDMFILY